MAFNQSITFLQTADPFVYKPMLDITSKTVVEYCRAKKFEYTSFVGIKRGFHPWQASFNRIFMLDELANSGYLGWAVYLDADAYIFDLGFRLRKYLSDKTQYSAIMVSAGHGPAWDVNSGVLMFNLSHPSARSIVHQWSSIASAVSEAQLHALSDWDGICNDQFMLFQILDANEDLRSSIYYESTNLMNHVYASFIRQYLRAHMPDVPSRIIAIKTAVDQILPENCETGQEMYLAAISALYRVLLGRDPDAGGIRNFSGRFKEMGFESAFRETLAEFLVSREYLDRRA